VIIEGSCTSHKTAAEDLTDYVVIVVSENEIDYGFYVQSVTNQVQTWSLFSGFIFTAIALFLTLLPDPSLILVQVTLFFLAIMFELLLAQIFAFNEVLDYCIRVAPPLPKRLTTGYTSRFWRSLWDLLYVSLGVVVVLMFLIWNLVVLAVASCIMYVLSVVFSYAVVRIPLRRIQNKFEARTRKSWRSRRFFDERDTVFESED